MMRINLFFFGILSRKSYRHLSNCEKLLDSYSPDNVCEFLASCGIYKNLRMRHDMNDGPFGIQALVDQLKEEEINDPHI